MKILKFLPAFLFIIFAISCNRGSQTINRAYQEACQGESAATVANTLVEANDIRCVTLDTDNAAKLGATLAYIMFYGQYSPDFDQQVDMKRFNWLLNDYRATVNAQTNDTKVRIEQLIAEFEMKGALLNNPPILRGVPEFSQQ